MAAYPGFIGHSNQLQSARADVERTVNMFVEQDTTGRPALYSIPGQRPFLTVTTDTDVRALGSMNDRTFAVVGSTVVEVFAGGTYVVRGTVAKNDHVAQLAFGGVSGGQLLIASGDHAYSLNLTTNVLSAPVLAGEARQIGILDGYGVALHPTTGRVRLSALNDFSTWDPTQFALRSSQPDTWQALLVNAPDLWLLGEQTGDVWYDAGTSPFPFAPRPGASFRYGILAPDSAIALGDSVFWLARNADGQGSVVRARGYVPQPINSFALDTALARYEETVSLRDAEALGCSWQGHLFYVLTLPAANATWVYDLRTGLWAEWGKWNSAHNQFDRWVPRVMCHAFETHLIGGSGSGIIATLDDQTLTELDGGELRRVRVPPAIPAAEGQRLIVGRFELDVDVGVGTVSGQGSDPQILMRVSYDFGKTWSSERRAALGTIGQYGTRVAFTRCGSSDVSWLPELVLTDPAPLRLTGASIRGSGIGRGM